MLLRLTVLLAALCSFASPSLLFGQEHGDKLNAGTIGGTRDTSLANTVYVKRGVPAFDRIWTVGDLSKAVDKLAELDAGKTCVLPRYRSKKSGAVFARLCEITDSDNLTNKNLPLNLRVTEGIEWMLASSRLLGMYVARQKKQQVSDRDVVEITGAVVTLMARSARVVNEIPKLEATDPNFAKKKAGREQFESGNTQTLAGVLQMLGETEAHALPARQRLLELCEEPFVVLFSNATPVGRKELAVKLREMVQDEKFATLQPVLGRLEARIAKLRLAESPAPSNRPQNATTMTPHIITAIYVAIIITVVVCLIVASRGANRLPPEILKCPWWKTIQGHHWVPNRLSPKTSGIVYILFEEEGVLELIGRKYHINRNTGKWAWKDIEFYDLYRRRRYDCPAWMIERVSLSRDNAWSRSAYLDLVKNPYREFRAISEARSLGWSSMYWCGPMEWLKATPEKREKLAEDKAL
jgi:hypothetical protein